MYPTNRLTPGQSYTEDDLKDARQFVVEFNLPVVRVPNPKGRKNFMAAIRAYFLRFGEKVLVSSIGENDVYIRMEE